MNAIDEYEQIEEIEKTEQTEQTEQIEKIVNLQDIPTCVINPMLNNHKVGLWFNTKGFWEHLAANHTAVDVMTFTRKLDNDIVPVKRMLVGCIDQFPNSADRRRIRFCPKLHAKVYIGYNSWRKPVAGYVGSLNFVQPTMHDIMVRLDDKKQVAALKKFFDAMWEACDPDDLNHHNS